MPDSLEGWEVSYHIYKSLHFRFVWISGRLTSSSIPIFLELAEEIDHTSVQVIGDEFLVVIARQCWNELDDCASDERLAMVFVAEHLFTDFIISFLHELGSGHGERYKRPLLESNVIGT